MTESSAQHFVPLIPLPSFSKSASESDYGLELAQLALVRLAPCATVESVEGQMLASEGSSSSFTFSSAFPALLVVIPIIVAPIVFVILILAVEPLHGV